MSIRKARFDTRSRKKLRIRKRLSGSEACPRLTVFKSSKHTYAQLISDVDGKTLLSASTLEKDVIAAIGTVTFEDQEKESTAPGTKSSKGILAAHAVGKILAERAKQKSLTKVVFDRNGFLYHGRVKAVADGARKSGLTF